MTPEQIADAKRLNALVDEFASNMKARLIQKVQEGFTGWDDVNKVSDQSLCDDISSIAIDWPACSIEGKIKRAQDVANRAMFLWWRTHHGH